MDRRTDRLILAIALGAMICGCALRFVAIDRIGLAGSDETYYTNIAQHWSDGERVLAIGTDAPLYRPVVYAVYGLAIRVFGFDDHSIKTANALIDGLNILLVFLLALLLSRRDLRIASAAAVIYALLPFTILTARSEQTHTLSTAGVLAASILIGLALLGKTNRSRTVLAFLAGAATGLTALTHEELIFVAVGATLALVFGPTPRGAGLRDRAISVVSSAGAYGLGVVAVAHRMLLTHSGEAQERASGIVGNRIDQSSYVDFLGRPLKFGWNAVSGTSSTILATVVVVVATALVVRLVIHLRNRSNGWRFPTMPVEDLPLWVVVCYLFVYPSFFGYYAARLFVPLIPLVVIWLLIRIASLTTRQTDRRTSTVTLLAVTVVLSAANFGHIRSIQEYQFSHFERWAPFAAGTDLRPDLGWREFKKRLLRISWARLRWNELGPSVNAGSRLLVGASTYHPFPGRRTLQTGFYFGDDAVFLFDHNQPLDRLLEEKRVEFVLFTTHQSYDRRTVEWIEHQRYLTGRRWAPPAPLVPGASLGFSEGEYTIAGEFDRLKRAMARKGARIILGRGALLEKEPSIYSTSSFVVWSLDPANWPPLESEITAVDHALELASKGLVNKALKSLETAEAGTDALRRFRLRLTAARILAENGSAPRAGRKLSMAVALMPPTTSLCTVLAEALPTEAETRETFRLFSDAMSNGPANPAFRTVLTGLSVNLAEAALDAGDQEDAVDAFNTIGDLLEVSLNPRFIHGVADWCASRGRECGRQGRVAESEAGLSAAAKAYELLLSSEKPPDPILLLTSGRTLSDLGRHREAAESLSLVTDVDPSNPAGWANLCLALSRSEALDDAMNACNEALRLDRGNVLANTAKIRLLGRSSRWIEAFDELMILMARSTAEIRDPVGLDRLEAVAAATIDGLIAHGSEHRAAKLAGTLGRFLSDRARHEAAVAALENATEMSPTSGEAWVNLCLARNRAGNPEGALKACQRSIDLQPEQFWARMISAEIHASEGSWPQAMRQAYLAAQSPPQTGDFARPLIRLAKTGAEAGHRDQSCRVLLTLREAEEEAVTPTLEELHCLD